MIIVLDQDRVDDSNCKSIFISVTGDINIIVVLLVIEVCLDGVLHYGCDDVLQLHVNVAQTFCPEIVSWKYLNVV